MDGAGKNRPLDEDELDFLERVRSQQKAKDRLEKEQDAAELDAYQLVSVTCPAAPQPEQSRTEILQLYLIVCTAPSPNTAVLTTLLFYHHTASVESSTACSAFNNSARSMCQSQACIVNKAEKLAAASYSQQHLYSGAHTQRIDVNHQQQS